MTRLLLHLPSWLGDFVMAEPSVAALERALSDGRLRGLSLVGPPRFLELLEGRCAGARRLGPLDDWRGHDAALFLDGSLRPLWRALRSGIGARWSSWSGGRWLLATEGFVPARERGATPLHIGRAGSGRRLLPRPFGAACAELVGWAGIAVDARAPRLGSTDAGRREAARVLERAGLDPRRPYLVLDASARPGSAKAAPAGLWAAVLTELAQGGAPSALLVTAPGEEELGRELARRAPRRSATLVEAPPSLGALLALIEGAALFLGPDSGPRHLALAVSTPALVLMGPTDPRHTADHTRWTRVQRARVPCGPCHRERCSEPPERRLRCFGELDAQAAGRAALEMLAPR